MFSNAFILSATNDLRLLVPSLSALADTLSEPVSVPEPPTLTPTTGVTDEEFGVVAVDWADALMATEFDDGLGGKNDFVSGNLPVLIRFELAGDGDDDVRVLELCMKAASLFAGLSSRAEAGEDSVAPSAAAIIDGDAAIPLAAVLRGELSAWVLGEVEKNERPSADLSVSVKGETAQLLRRDVDPLVSSGFT